MTLLRERLLVFFFPLLLSLPFINRAYFVDDHYFVRIAEWLKDNPGRPYDFRADDAGIQNLGWEKDGFVRMVNPLLHHYYLALLIKMGGAREWFLRLGSVLLSCAAALFILGFARRWTAHPVLATLLILSTPAYALTAHSLLIDSTMGFLFFGGLYYFVRATERESLAALGLSGLFMGAAVLAKYTGLLILPLSGIWFLLRRKKLRRRALYAVPWIIALLFLAAYSVWTDRLYGRPHILAASARMVHTAGWAKVMILFVFFSGATLLPLLSWGLLGLRRAVWAALAVYVLALFFASPAGGFSAAQGALLGLWIVTSAIFLGGFWSFKSRWIYPRDHFLFIWLLAFLGLMVGVMDWVAGRYYVIVAPAVGLAAVRLMETRFGARADRYLRSALAVLLAATASLGYADYKQADSSRRVVRELKSRGFSGGERHFYLGDSFTMSYLGHEGWAACFPDTRFRVGDWILGNEVTMPLKWFRKSPVVLKPLAEFAYPTRFPVKVMHYEGSAGWYASVWGALPFTFQPGPWERFHLFQVVALTDEI